MDHNVTLLYFVRKMLRTLLNEKFRVCTSGDHQIYRFPIRDFHDLGARPWKQNRPVDETRLAEIREAMDTAGHMDGIIPMAFIPGQGLVWQEAGHRVAALAMTARVDAVLVDILWDADDSRVAEEFKRINKAISVPSLYTEGQQDSQIRVEIEALVNLYRKRQPSHVSNTARPCRPNFNRDKLNDELYRLHKELSIPVSTLAERLEAKNQDIANRDHSKLTLKVIEKCRASGLWLFAQETSLHV